ncbi:hypothetical protein D3C86_1483400 [compost metagenome]
MSDRLPKAVPLVTVDWTIEAVFSWLRPPAEVLRSNVRVWDEMPRPSAHFTFRSSFGSAGSMMALGSDLPKSSTALAGSSNRPLPAGQPCMVETSRRPAGVKAMMPFLIWPFE